MSLVQELNACITELQQALAERDATIAAVTAEATRPSSWTGQLSASKVLAILFAAPGDALRAHDAEVQAKALEDARETLKGWYANGDVDPIGALGYLAKAIREQESDND